MSPGWLTCFEASLQDRSRVSVSAGGAARRTPAHVRRGDWRLRVAIRVKFGFLPDRQQADLSTRWRLGSRLKFTKTSKAIIFLVGSDRIIQKLLKRGVGLKHHLLKFGM